MGQNPQMDQNLRNGFNFKNVSKSKYGSYPKSKKMKENPKMEAIPKNNWIKIQIIR